MLKFNGKMLEITSSKMLNLYLNKQQRCVSFSHNLTKCNSQCMSNLVLRK
jgi:hypothetical protein